MNRWINAINRRWTMCIEPDRYVLRKNLYDFQREICRRSLLPFNEINLLSQPIADDHFKAIVLDMHEPLYYGALYALLDYAGLSSFFFSPLNLGIQHGYVFEIKNYEKSKLEKRNLVWSQKLVNMYHEFTSNQDIYAIGAPFFYAKSLLDEKQLKEEKKRLGKTLLVFPMHSQIDVDTNYDTKKLISILAEERKRFDTVLICMYWKDVLRGSYKVYADNGYECVCNGHLYDQNFLRRQKSLFSLADATLSNGIGSHIGYSLYMGKPHWLVDDEYEYVNTRANGDAKDLSDVKESKNFLGVKEAFVNNTDYQITDKQINVINDFWGISDMKSPEEMKRILLKLYDL